MAATAERLASFHAVAGSGQLRRWLDSGAGLARRALVTAARRRRASAAGQSYRHSSEDRPLSSVQEDLVRRYAPGASFADVGCMWRIHGAVAYLAEEVGATDVTAVDVMEETPEYLAEHERRSSKVAYRRVDIHDREGMAALGRHDVVWCSGVLYHTPNPSLAVEHLLSITERYLVLGNKTMPEIPGVAQAAVFLPGLSARERLVYEPLWGEGVMTPFGTYQWGEANWWWALTPSSMCAIIEANRGFEVVEQVYAPWSGTDDNFFAVARRAR